MSIADHIANHTFEQVEACTEDEYQREVVYKSYAVGYSTMVFSLYTVGAIFAWLLEGQLSQVSVVVIFPYVLAEMISTQWMIKHVPRPKPTTPRLLSTALVALPAAIMTAGMFYNTYQTGKLDTASGIIVGAILGFLGGLVFTPLIINLLRARDQRLLDASFDD